MKKVIKKVNEKIGADIDNIVNKFLTKADKKDVTVVKSKELSYSLKSDFPKGIYVFALQTFLATKVNSNIVAISAMVKGSKIIVSLELAFSSLTKKERKVKKLLDCSNAEARYIVDVMTHSFDVVYSKDTIKEVVRLSDEDGVIVSKKDVQTIFVEIFKIEKVKKSKVAKTKSPIIKLIEERDAIIQDTAVIVNDEISEKVKETLTDVVEVKNPTEDSNDNQSTLITVKTETTNMSNLAEKLAEYKEKKD